MTAYYNENDPKAAAWLRELIATGNIAWGDVDTRSIEDVTPLDVAGAIRNVTFSQASEGGAMLCDSLIGLIPDGYGLALARANLSARQAKAVGLLTSAIYGPLGTISLTSAALQSSLESRLRARMALTGSTLFTLTWKYRTTPLGLQICALRASGRRTSDSDCTSWPTTTALDCRRGVSLPRPTDTGVPLSQAVAWATVTVRDSRGIKGGRDRPGKTGGPSLLQTLLTLGETPNGSTAPTGSIVRLNPEFSRWLMGYPMSWGLCGATAMQSLRPSRRSL